MEGNPGDLPGTTTFIKFITSTASTNSVSIIAERDVSVQEADH